MWVNTRHYSVQLLVNTRHLTKILKIVREKKQHEALLHYAAVQLWVNTRHLTLAWHFTRTTCLLVIMRWKYQHKQAETKQSFTAPQILFCPHCAMRLPACKPSETPQKWELLFCHHINFSEPERVSERFTAARKERKVIRGRASCRSWSHQMASKEEEERRTKEELSFVWRDIEFDIVYLALGDFDMCLSVFVILIRCVCICH